MSSADRHFFRQPMRMVRVAVALFFVVAQAATKIIRPTDRALQYIGRTAVVPVGPNATEAGYDAVIYDMPGVEVRFRVRGTTSVSALIQQHWSDGPAGATSNCSRPWGGDRPNNFLAFLDGTRNTDHGPGSTCLYCTFDTGAHDRSPHPETYALYRDLDPSREYEIRLSKDSEADFDSCEPWPNWVMLHGILIESEGQIREPETRHAPAKIEIIGSSTTSGYCNLCSQPWMAPTDTPTEKLKGTSLHKAWVGQMCGPHGMDAHCYITAWSGMGVASSLDSRAEVHLPTIFRRTVQSMPDGYQDLGFNNTWNFSTWVPEVVVLDIGLEDKNVWGEQIFEDQYKKLVYDIVSWYGPRIKILAGCGMTDETYCRQIQRMCNYFVNHNIYVHYLDLRRSGHNENTCCGRPDKQTHEDLASYVQQHVASAIEDHNGPGRAGRGPLAAKIMVVCFVVTVLVFLCCKLLRRCKSTSPFDADSDEGEVPFRDSELQRRG